MDFTSDELFERRRIRLLTIMDNYTRESLAIKVAASIGGQGVVEVLHQLMKQHRVPRAIRVDNAFIEAFNGRFRQEFLNENWFLSLEDPGGESGILADTLQ